MESKVASDNIVLKFTPAVLPSFTSSEEEEEEEEDSDSDEEEPGKKISGRDASSDDDDDSDEEDDEDDGGGGDKAVGVGGVGDRKDGKSSGGDRGDSGAVPLPLASDVLASVTKETASFQTRATRRGEKHDIVPATSMNNKRRNSKRKVRAGGRNMSCEREAFTACGVVGEHRQWC
jgi:hypothetical protein